MSQAELLAVVVAVFNELGIECMLVGSHAASFYGEPRSTHDIDLVIDLDPAKIVHLVARFDPERYYVSESAFREGRMANIIDTLTGDKVDCFILGNQASDRTAFQRRKKQLVMGVSIPLASAEDTILSQEKLETRIAESTAAGREALEVWYGVIQAMSGSERVAKAFELTEITRQTMREGIRYANPSATENEIQELYVDRLLRCSGMSLAEVRQKQKALFKSGGDRR